MTSIPTPKFQIDQTVFVPVVDYSTERLPCPDCLGSGVWKVVTPAGTEMSTVCQRCSDRYGRIGDLPRPERTVYVARVRSLTVGSVRIDTAETRTAPVSYMCRETGIGSGSVYYEDRLFETEAEAQEAAEREASERTAAADAKPSAERTRKISGMQVIDAVLDDAWHAKWRAWYAYREVIEQITDDEATLESVREDIDFRERVMDRGEVENALRDLQSITPDTTEARELFAKLKAPEFASKATSAAA